jgi:predicted nucleotidyltransferase component of viral defense system
MLRVATEQELNFYTQTLYSLQDSVFALLADRQDIYLTGGTALARFYFNHQLSEDVDFFIKIEPDDSLDVIKHQRRADVVARDLAGKLSRTCNIANPTYSETFSRFFVETVDCTLKIDVAREYNHIGQLIQQPDGFYINNLEDIGAAKITAFEDRCEIKDIVDLFYLTQQLPLERLFELTDQKREPVAYENLLTINTQGVSGAALVIKEIPPRELTDFINALKEAAEKEVKKKEEQAAREIDKLVKMTLWDFPNELKNINAYSIPVLKRRLNQMPLPQRNAIKKLLLA